MHPSSFRKELKRFDKELRLVWSGKKSRWEIWHKDRRGTDYIVLSVPIGQLGPNVIQSLYNATPIKQGGARRLNRILDRMREKEEEAEKAETANIVASVEEDAYNSLKRRIGERVSVPGFTINDTRRNKPEAVGAS
ncbi:MAG: hypothetical protein ACE5DX_05760 [Candidatus Dojkabacteria bacterium]